jgi:hypothetical protein
MGKKTKKIIKEFENHDFVFRLKESSLSILEKYGSQLIKIIKFRDSFVMMGQKGLARGKAIEMVDLISKFLIEIFFLFFLASTKRKS